LGGHLGSFEQAFFAALLLLKEGLARLRSLALVASDVVRAGALVAAEDDDGVTVCFFLAPEGGGTKLSGGVQVVTPASPLGAALLGKRAGDEVELKRGATARVVVPVYLCLAAARWVRAFVAEQHACWLASRRRAPAVRPRRAEPSRIGVTTHLEPRPGVWPARHELKPTR
jgi:hypothetical protein